MPVKKTTTRKPATKRPAVNKLTENNRSVKVTDLKITDFFKTKYLDFAKYTISFRAIPSVVDGFKTGARKILHAALSGKAKKGTDIKTLNLIGDVFSYSAYSHGDASLDGTIITMSSDYTDNLAPLHIKGQGGYLRDDVSASARYLYVRLSKYTDILYKTDYDLLEFLQHEGKSIEPRYYLPLIPTVLTANTSGIGVGYGFSSFSYNPLDIINSIRSYICYGHVTGVRPYVKGLSANAAWFYHEDRWHNQGHYQIVPKSGRGLPNKIVITEWPFDKMYEPMEEYYDKLVIDGVIDEWVNLSKGNDLHYELHIKDQNKFADLIKDAAQLDQTIKNTTKVNKDNLTVLDENGRLRYFEKPEDLIKYFADFRIGIYTKRKTFMIDKIKQRMEKISDTLRFIQLVIDGKLILSNRAIAAVKKDLDKHKIGHFVLATPISKITKEEFALLKKELAEIKTRLDYIIKTPVQVMYLDDLDELQQQIKDDFITQPFLQIQPMEYQQLK